MHIQNRPVILFYRIILVLAAGTGLWYGLGLNRGYCDFSRLVYYTFLSNLLCLLFFLATVVYTAKALICAGIKGDATPWPRLKCGLTVIISITFLVFWLVLSPMLSSTQYAPHVLANRLLHYITPLMTIVDWFLFDHKSAYKRIDPVLWLAGPLAYLAFIFIRAPFYGNIGHTNSPYPYFFLNLDVIGPWRFTLYVIALAAFVVALGYFFMLVAKICTLKNRRR